MGTLAVLFPTLASVGFIECRHPRTDHTTQQCPDCGAERIPTGWLDGSLLYLREPLRYG